MPHPGVWAHVYVTHLFDAHTHIQTHEETQKFNNHTLVPRKNAAQIPTVEMGLFLIVDFILYSAMFFFAQTCTYIQNTHFLTNMTNMK